MEMEREVLILNLDDVLPNRFQPRIKFNEQNILELAESIKEHGVIQPIVVRKISDKYEIIAGERRYKASVLAGKTTIPAIVTNLDDKNSAEIALIENIQRQDLTPIEEAVSYKKILDMGYLNQISLAEKLGKKQSTIANKLRLLNLDDEVQEALLEEKISERHARSLLRLEKEEQIKMLNRILTERMTVRKTDDEILKMLNNFKNEKETSFKNSDAIEILEFDNILKDKGENVMNSELLNEINIPSNPIIDESLINPFILNKEENLQSNTISENVVNNELKPNEVEKINNPQQKIISLESIINPGFMDIEKIEKQAQDIFPQPVTPIEEPIIEIVEKVQPVMPVQEIIKKTEEEENPTGGRFFNMFNLNKEEDPNFINDLESKEVNMNSEQIQVPSNFQFNPFLNKIQDATPAREEPVVNQETIANNSSEVQPIQPVPVEIEVQSENILPEKPREIPVTEEESFINPVNTYSLTDDEEFTTNSFTEIKSNKETFIPANNNVGINNELPVTMQTNQVVIEKNEFRNVINAIRNCTNTIEKYGYTIDTEELDFENSYQVTFKIDK